MAKTDKYKNTFTFEKPGNFFNKLFSTLNYKFKK